MRVGILLAGRCPTELRERHGDYDEMFERLLQGRGFEFTTYAVLDGVLPAHASAEDGWLVTGSKAGVYEDHDWIPPLQALLREAYANAVPTVGICFGHQILAQALGGTVRKFPGGWSVGLKHYALQGDVEEARVLAWHQDQVIEPPPDARVVGSSPFCRYAALAYGDKAYSIQPHPEFTNEFVTDLLAVRRNILPEHVFADAEASMGPQTSSAQIADRIAEVLRR
jgi:GMP synthase-like glutamine amidotransferase